MTDAKRRAQEGLAEMVDAALDTMRQSVTGKLAFVRGSTRTNDARFVLSAVLELPDAKPDAAREGAETPVKTMGQLAELSERIRLLKQNERRGA